LSLANYCLGLGVYYPRTMVRRKVRRMNAAVLHNLGDLPRFEQFEEPEPGPDEMIVQVVAASLKPVDKQMASGTHYASFRELPVVCGIDGVGFIDDGSRVFFAGPRRPFGAMAQRTVVARSRCWPIPAKLDDLTASALPNPGVSAWMSLAWRAQLTRGQTVLILGATGVTGKLAVQLAKLLGAGRVVAAGRNEEALSTMSGFGADRTIALNQPLEELKNAFIQAAMGTGFDIVIDYVWGRPTEALLAAITGADLAPRGSRIRLLQVGESAGPAISLSASALRSSGLEIMGAGSGAAPPMDVLERAFQQVLAHAVRKELHINVESVPLADIAGAWRRETRARLVVVP
jgi:NADPH:quinone reductase-like Zn-dependent oxidoreductase